MSPRAFRYPADLVILCRETTGLILVTKQEPYRYFVGHETGKAAPGEALDAHHVVIEGRITREQASRGQTKQGLATVRMEVARAAFPPAQKKKMRPGRPRKARFAA